MSLMDALAGDLDRVFYSDFKHVARVNGVDVTGYFSKVAGEYESVDAEVHQFEAPAARLSNVVQGSTVVYGGRSYKVGRVVPHNDLIVMVLE